MGAFLSKVLPDWILIIALVFLLAFTTYTTLEKGVQQWNKESKTFADEKRSILTKTLEKDDDDSESLPLLSDRNPHKENIVVVRTEDEENNLEETKPAVAPLSIDKPALASRLGETSQELEALLAEESKTPMDKVWMITIMIVVVIILNLLKGGGVMFPSPLGLDCAGSGYWFITVLVFVWILGFSYHTRNLLIEKWRLKLKLRYRYIEGDVEWNPTNTLIYPAICFFAGFFAGLFGIGGGIVKGPLMLFMGVHPLVASATCAVMIMFTSLAGTTMYIAFGTLQWDYGWFMFVLGLAATCVGQFGVSYLVQKYRRVSLVSLSIGAVVALSTVLMAIQSIFSLIDYENRPPKSTLCGA